MGRGTIWFSTDTCLWDIICTNRGWDQCVYAAYFRREVAQQEVDRLRKKYPRATIAIKVSNYRIGGERG